jgi:hypothetical protein
MIIDFGEDFSPALTRHFLRQNDHSSDIVSGFFFEYNSKIETRPKWPMICILAKTDDGSALMEAEKGEGS